MRRGWQPPAPQSKKVSIHAPTRGATNTTMKANNFKKVSIHAPTRGATTQDYEGELQTFSFNPRTHTGCDFTNLKTMFRTKSFNPRTHTGCDVSYIHNNFTHSRFQSTHPHGVRQKNVFYDNQRCEVSIHAPTRGAT